MTQEERQNRTEEIATKMMEEIEGIFSEAKNPVSYDHVIKAYFTMKIAELVQVLEQSGIIKVEP